MNRRQSLEIISASLGAVLLGRRAAFAHLLRADKQRMTVYKTSTCGCCKAWVDHVRMNGFEAEAIDVDDVLPYKKKYGVPLELASCHTAVVGGYVFEGHVPADLIQRLLRERPKGAKGLAVPGMPIGSPGMEIGGRKDAYDVLLINQSGGHRVFAKR